MSTTTKTSKPVTVLSYNDDRDIVNEAYVDTLVAKQAERWQADGVGEDYLFDLCEAFKAQLMAGTTPKVAARKMLVEVEDAKRETLFASHVRTLIAKFHVKEEVARELIEQAKRHAHPNARPEFNKAIAPVYAQVQAASREAYVARRASRSPMAAALMRSGITS